MSASAIERLLGDDKEKSSIGSAGEERLVAGPASVLGAAGRLRRRDLQGSWEGMLLMQARVLQCWLLAGQDATVHSLNPKWLCEQTKMVM